MGKLINFKIHMEAVSPATKVRGIGYYQNIYYEMLAAMREIGFCIVRQLPWEALSLPLRGRDQSG